MVTTPCLADAPMDDRLSTGSPPSAPLAAPSVPESHKCPWCDETLSAPVMEWRCTRCTEVIRRVSSVEEEQK